MASHYYEKGLNAAKSSTEKLHQTYILIVGGFTNTMVLWLYFLSLFLVLFSNHTSHIRKDRRRWPPSLINHYQTREIKLVTKQPVHTMKVTAPSPHSNQPAAKAPILNPRSFDLRTATPLSSANGAAIGILHHTN
jgi:hypothetical protein